MLQSAPRILVAIALTATALAVAAPASATVFGFEESVFTRNDDLSIEQVFPGYGGLGWDQVAATYVPENIPSGFPGWYVGVGCSPSTANTPGLACHGAYNQASTNTISSLSGLITVNSLHLTSPFGSGSVKITDSSGRSSGVITLTDSARTLIQLNWAGISYFKISNVDGSGNPVSISGPTWVMDDLTINTPVPEPASAVLVLAGLLASVPLMMRRRIR